MRQLRSRFALEYQAQPRVFSAPGRVNLIGEHTDYNEGFVLPMAIEQRTYVAGSLRSDQRVVVRSLHTGERCEFDLKRPGAKRRGSWLDYVEGTAQAMIERGFALSGANLLIDSDVPSGAGLSASAALEVATGYALACLSGVTEPDLVQLALAGQAAEHAYVGTMCGIMDQYIVALARPGCALLIDCRSLTPTSIPLQLGTACVLICDTQVKHELSSSAYNQRRLECQEAVIALRTSEISTLRDVDIETFERRGELLSRVIRQRCRHVVTESQRTLLGARDLEYGRLENFGALMLASHASLRDDYQVSCAELDAAVELAAAEPGVYGARMTGGGFGGCTVTLLEQSAVARVERAITTSFATRFAAVPRFFTAHASGGVREEEAL